MSKTKKLAASRWRFPARPLKFQLRLGALMLGISWWRRESRSSLTAQGEKGKGYLVSDLIFSLYQQ
jgi:hypothetical protein